MAKAKNTREETAVNALFLNCKHNAIKRGKKFQLSKKDYAALIAQCCYYCGAQPKNTVKKVGKYEYACAANGVDRKDNSIGYTQDNCVACCWRCNKIKGEFLDHEETLHIIRALNEFKLVRCLTRLGQELKALLVSK